MAGKENQPSDELMVGEGPVVFFKENDRLFLCQGEVAVDITKMVVDVNYPLGRVVLNTRLHDYKGNTATNRESAKSVVLREVEDEKVEEDA